MASRTCSDEPGKGNVVTTTDKTHAGGGPAFPATGSFGPGVSRGMTKREYVATAILAGMLAGRNGKPLDPGVFHIDAKWAANCADALLLELGKP